MMDEHAACCPEVPDVGAQSVPDLPGDGLRLVDVTEVVPPGSVSFDVVENRRRAFCPAADYVGPSLQDWVPIQDR